MSNTISGEDVVKAAYPELLESFSDDVDKDGIDFEFELERPLNDSEWKKMPEVLTIYDVSDCVFQGAYK